MTNFKTIHVLEHNKSKNYKKEKMNLKIKENTKLFNNYQIQLEMTINRNLIYFKDKIVNKQE